MKRTIDEHAERFDRKAQAYDDYERPVYAATRDLVIEAANPSQEDVVLDIGTGTGAIALALAPTAAEVIGRDISEEMLEQARSKAAGADLDNVSFGQGSFRSPNYDGPADVVTSNYAMHHLDDHGKREAIGRIAQYRPDRFVLGDVMLFGDRHPDEPAFDPTVDDPATVGVLVSAFTDAGFVITALEKVTDQAGVIVAEGTWAR